MLSNVGSTPIIKPKPNPEFSTWEYKATNPNQAIAIKKKTAPSEI
ncbi:hypothetical protein PNIG_a1814 [Pseudoalteromonas nigrifaciens]|uniref:Uncharacterized protein n=1 Tax=Pseudoalteromonas nigrifaciens TaxID=28109 RepID=A0AAC9XXD8_9GAMM|nr:hypothetical protein PNIG_a1814 [Pseudoalteromonas nigrifaciens]